MPGLQKCKGNKKRNEWQKKAFRAEKINSELKEKGHEPSRAELKISQLELWLEPARLGLITTSRQKKFPSQQKKFGEGLEDFVRVFEKLTTPYVMFEIS